MFHEAKSAETGERDPYNHPLYRDGRTFDSFKLSVIQRERNECTGFTPWWPGYSPKEHMDMIHDRERSALEFRRTLMATAFGVIGALVAAAVGAVLTVALTQ